VKGRAIARKQPEREKLQVPVRLKVQSAIGNSKAPSKSKRDSSDEEDISGSTVLLPGEQVDIHLSPPINAVFS
jgi:hypothetical protein